MDPILMYLTTGILPTKKNEAQRVKFRAVRYHIINGVLYKRGYRFPYLWCVHSTQVGDILQDIHEGICGSHIGGWALSRGALLQGYYWPTMTRDSHDYVKWCDKCQRYASMINHPAESQTPILSP